MGKFFNDKVEEAIRLVWMTYKKEEMHRGFTLLQESVNEGDADGYCFLARCYMGKLYVWSGGGLPVDDAQAALYLKESILRGSAAGILCAMRCGELTPAVRKNMPMTLKDAFDHILLKAEGGHPFCQYMIGNAYFWGDMLEIEGKEDMMKRYPTEHDYKAYAYPTASGWFQKAFQGGYSFGFGNFCKIYEEGRGGITPNPALIGKWQKFIADAGDPVQQCNYGCLLQDRGDLAGAFRYYKQAAENGSIAGAYNTGYFYEDGKGTEKDLANAFDYYMKAAQEGDLDGQFKVGCFYFEGVGDIPEDNAKAVYWLTQSLEQGCIYAYPQLAICYQQGWGVQKDAAYAFYLSSEGEKYLDEYGNSFKGFIFFCLGNAYAFGDGAPEDIERGIAYYDEALAVGYDYAAHNRARFKKSLFGLGKWKCID